MYEDSITQEMIRQIIVPSGMRKDILHLLHEGPTNGHLCVAKTLAKLRNRYYWNNYMEDVENLCRSCSLCASRNNPSRNNRSSLTKYTVGLPLERIRTDIVGPLPKSYSGMRYILVVVEYFTKWAEAYPMKNQEAETVAKKWWMASLQDLVYLVKFILTKGDNLRVNFFRNSARCWK